MSRYSSNRRGDIVLDRCECGWSLRKRRWVRNGCKRHPVVPAANSASVPWAMFLEGQLK